MMIVIGMARRGWRFLSLLIPLLLLLGLAAATARSSPSLRSMVTINTLDDGADANPADCICATSDQLCSLRAAIETANACAGPDTIQFGISGVIAPYYPLPPLADSSGGVTIDGYSAPGASPNSAPIGAPVNAVITVILDGSQRSFDGLTMTSNGNVVRGLAILNFDGEVGAPYYSGIVISGGRQNVIAGNFLGLAPDGSHGSSYQRAGVDVRALSKLNRIGGLQAADRNVISGNRYAGVRIEGNLALTNTVQGNLIGLAPDGATLLPGSEQLYGVHLANIAYDNLVLDNVISGNRVAGVVMSHSAGGNQVSGNLIGPQINGQTVVPGSTQADGVWINSGASNNVVQNNVISANGANGVRISGSGTFRNHLWGNTIGPALGGGQIPGHSQALGVRIMDGATTNEVGGVSAGLGNRVAFNLAGGVTVEGDGTLYNQVHGNDLTGNGAPRRAAATASGDVSDVQTTAHWLDLGADGPTPDDPGDADSGPNNLQNRPVISNVIALINEIQLDLLVDSSPAYALYPLTIDFYRLTDAGDAAPNEQGGHTWIGRVDYESPQTVITPRFIAAFVPSDNSQIVATATDAAGNTSEFTEAATLSQRAFTVTDLGDEPDANAGDCLCSTAGGECTLRAAIESANACAGPHAIGFQVAGVIAPASPLPPLTDSAGLWIDGLSAPGAQANSAGLTSPINAQLTIRLEGSDLVTDGLTIESDNNRIGGLAIAHFTGRGVVLRGSNNSIYSSFVGIEPDGATGSLVQQVGIAVESGAFNLIGGTKPSDRMLVSGNIAAGIVISSAAYSSVVGASIGPDASGIAAVATAEQQVGLWIGGGSHHTGVGVIYPTARPHAMTPEVLTGSSNLISGNRTAGLLLGPGANQTLVLDNLIGPAASGQSALTEGGQNTGVLIEDASNNEIGWLDHSNQISGNDLAGVVIRGANASFNLLRANLIGPALSGSIALSGGHQIAGVIIEEGAHDNGIGDVAGSLATLPRNIVRFNTQDGVIVRGETTIGNRISGNIIIAGSGPALDLNNDGATLNDAADADVGPNRLQNFPEIYAVLHGDPEPGGPESYNPFEVSFRIDTAAIHATYPITVEFFRANSMAGGQPLSYLGATNYQWYDAQSIVSRLVEPVQSTPFWWPIVTTATDAAGNTSEFSEPYCPANYPDVNRSGIVDIADIMIVASLLGRSPYLYDSNCDGLLSLVDLTAIALTWQPCIPGSPAGAGAAGMCD